MNEMGNWSHTCMLDGDTSGCPACDEARDEAKARDDLRAKLAEAEARLDEINKTAREALVEIEIAEQKYEAELAERDREIERLKEAAIIQDAKCSKHIHERDAANERAEEAETALHNLKVYTSATEYEAETWTSMGKALEKAEADNARLREALDHIGGMEPYQHSATCMAMHSLANNALTQPAPAADVWTAEEVEQAHAEAEKLDAFFVDAPASEVPHLDPAAIKAALARGRRERDAADPGHTGCAPAPEESAADDNDDDATKCNCGGECHNLVPDGWALLADLWSYPLDSVHHRADAEIISEALAEARADGKSDAESPAPNDLPQGWVAPGKWRSVGTHKDDMCESGCRLDWAVVGRKLVCGDCGAAHEIVDGHQAEESPATPEPVIGLRAAVVVDDETNALETVSPVVVADDLCAETVTAATAIDPNAPVDIRRWPEESPAFCTAELNPTTAVLCGKRRPCEDHESPTAPEPSSERTCGECKSIYDGECMLDSNKYQDDGGNDQWYSKKVTEDTPACSDMFEPKESPQESPQEIALSGGEVDRVAQTGRAAAPATEGVQANQSTAQRVVGSTPTTDTIASSPTAVASDRAAGEKSGAHGDEAPTITPDEAREAVGVINSLRHLGNHEELTAVHTLDRFIDQQERREKGEG